MAGNLGDIVVSAGIDSRKWYEQVVGLQNSSKQLGSSIQMGIGGRGFTGSIGQAAFAAQDFASVLGMGGEGALGRALMSTMNNVQMLGAAFGPWGMAATAAAGALGAILIPQLMKGESATESFTKSLEKNIATLDRQVKKSNEAIGFSEKLRAVGESGTRTGLDSDIREGKVGVSKLTAERDLVAQEFSQAIGAAVRAGAVKITDPLGRGLFNASGLVDSRVAFNLDSTVLGEKATEKIVGLKDRLALLNKDVGIAEKNLDSLKGMAPAVTRNDEQAFESKRLQDVLAARRSDPIIGAQIQAREIGLLLGRGLEPEAGNRALSSVVKGLRGSLNLPDVANQANAASIGGTSAAFSDLQASIRQDRALQTDLTQVQKEALAMLKQIVAEIRAQNSLKTPEAEID